MCAVSAPSALSTTATGVAPAAAAALTSRGSSGAGAIAARSDFEDVEALVVQLGIAAQQDRRPQCPFELLEDRPLLALQRPPDFRMHAQEQLARVRAVAQAQHLAAQLEADGGGGG